VQIRSHLSPFIPVKDLSVVILLPHDKDDRKIGGRKNGGDGAGFGLGLGDKSG
jgi:hypothetical protein